MSNDDYKALLAKMIADPDTANDTASAIIAEIEKDATAANEFAEAARKEVQEKDDKIKALESDINKYKAQEFLGTMGNQNAEPFDPIKNAVDIAATIINPHYNEKEK